MPTERVTKETQVDESGWTAKAAARSILRRLLDHMLCTAIPTAASAWLTSAAICIDDHTVEDTGLALGEALKLALATSAASTALGFVLPMDECLARCAGYPGGRPHLEYKADFTYQRVGDLSTEMVEHFRSLLHHGG